MKWKVVIIDDSEKDIKLLESFLSDFDFIQIEKRFTDPLKFKAEQKALKFDAIFLDVNMPSLSGIDLLDDIKKPVIFVTGEGKDYSEELSDRELFYKNVVCVVTKPVNKRRVEAALEKLKGILKPKTHIQVNTSEGKVLIEISTIEVISSQDIDLKNLVPDSKNLAQGEHKIIYRKGIEPLFIHSRNLSDLLSDLPSDQFIQINRFDIVNKNAISPLVKYDEMTINYTSKDLTIKPATRTLSPDGTLKFKELFNL